MNCKCPFLYAENKVGEGPKYLTHCLIEGKRSKSHRKNSKCFSVVLHAVVLPSCANCIKIRPVVNIAISNLAELHKAGGREGIHCAKTVTGGNS